MSLEQPRALALRNSALFAGDALDLEDARERWRAEVADPGVYEVGGVRPNFYFGWDAVVMPRASLISLNAVGMTYARDTARLRRDGRDGVKVQLTHEGGFTGRLGERDVVVGPGTAVFVDESQTFFNDSADTRCRTLALPRDALEGVDVRALHGRVVSGAAFARLDEWFVLQSRLLLEAPASALDRVTAAMGAMVRGAFDTQAEAKLQDSGALDDLAVARLRTLAVDPLRSGGRTAAELARAIGVSRSALYRATAAFGGVMEVVWVARADAAHAVLLSGERPRALAELAPTLGFHDAAHLQRRFYARFGYRPGDVRPIRS